MSAIVNYRDRVVEAIKTKFTDLRNVDWYDGIFDVDDIRTWGGDAPSAYVSVLNVPTEHHSTGELNGTLRVVVAVVTTDLYEPRDHDRQNWTFIEGIADFAKLNKFGDPNAAPATQIDFKRLRHPELRREGVGLGIVEWQATVTFGLNTNLEAEQIHDPLDETRWIDMPRHLRATTRNGAGTVTEAVDFDDFEQPI